VSRKLWKSEGVMSGDSGESMAEDGAGTAESKVERLVRG